MSKEKSGYRIRQGFIPFKKSKFVLENHDESKATYENSLERKGNIVFANLFAFSQLAYNDLKINSIPYGFRPKKDYVVISLGGYHFSKITQSVDLDRMFIYKDGSVEIIDKEENNVTEMSCIIIRAAYWETEDIIENGGGIWE